ncbi:hypothetical protein [Actinobaculum sp. 352]|uniref:phage tail tube protein n=1 Tax=Actinobaculum sp. 352 TaxID=2490946 RepID=UPI000F7F271F|nr:hypothetical protein [Actinobaculum sp. 352]RTE47891.1 hypothetical protein EKN07_11570 [Actinobaculum sp. 352]
MSQPTGDYTFSYEYGVDIKLTDGSWQPIRFISAVQPTVSAKELDGATYDDKGADHPVKVGETASLTFNVQGHRLADGAYLPEVEALLAANEPDATGTKATVTVRYYDKPAAGTANPNDAYELDATVNAFARQNTDNASLGGWTVTLNGQGPRRKITNPAATPGTGE